MNYYKILVKCGHVGRNNYVLKNVYIKAENGKEAAKKAREFPRVKHDKKDAIRELIKISLEEYVKGMKGMKNDNYFNVHSIQKQKELNVLDNVIIYREPEEVSYKKQRNGQRLRNIELIKNMEMQIREAYYEQN